MEGLLHYINPAHAISLLSALNEERLKGQLCDVLLIVGDQKFRAHKNVLAASSEYFQSLFASKESAAQSVFQLDFCEPDTFDHVLNYMYSSSLFVERGGLAAVQELGYSLGISFLTNIVSRTPQAPFPLCPGRRAAALADDEDSGAQKRSVIVCQGRSEAPSHAASPSASELGPGHRPSPSAAAKLSSGPPQGPAPGDPSRAVVSPERPSAAYPKALEHMGTAEESGRGSPLRRAPAGPDREGAGPEKPGAVGPLPKGRALELALRRPRPPVPPLRSASETPYLLTETGRGGGSAEDRNLLYYSKLGLVIPSPGAATPGSQSIDRSGPLVKSLLRRSLSMDSQVPVYSPAIDLKPSSGVPAALGDTAATMRCGPVHKAAFPECAEITGVNARAPTPQPHRLRSFSASQSTEREAPPASEVPIKTEPRSPLSDPSDIIRVTVGDVAAAGSRDLALKTEDDPKAMSRLPAKRRFQADRRLPLKKLRADGHGSPASAEPAEGAASPPLLDANFAEPHSPRDAFEQGPHERLCRNAAVCPYCSLRFFSPELRREHEGQCEHRKLTCLECMRTFKSAFSIWRHQVEVHNQNSMAPPDSLDHNGEAAAPATATTAAAATTTTTTMAAAGPPRPPGPPNHATAAAAKDDPVFSDSSEHVNFDSEDSCLPEDLSLSRPLRVQVKEEPAEEVEDEAVPAPPTAAPEAPKDSGAGSREPGLWPCEKCGKTFPAPKQLERHQELLCSVKPFICHVCSKAFRTNFRLWSHFQSHMAQAADDPAAPKDPDTCPGPTSSPSPPPLPPPPPLPKIQPLEPDSPTGLPDTPAPAPGATAAEKLFVPQESDTLFYHAPPLSAITFKRQFMCKLCHRTFKTAFSLWSHEQTHN
ncbi:zinc finger and BTB domain-containing protein 21 isoform X2 [Sorex fumeus]|uniref:zinc finger and BTB domain-containing protein 21 isoform X2 n=1 Tax=Sorex fumeus TaxID=62283 RepID=UPI0024ADDD71|nr:zinc finger and BTB domain-containing protein 21 isoform X2 [Sorex fumeus]